jgi:hypothetical protein
LSAIVTGPSSIQLQKVYSDRATLLPALVSKG